MIDIKAIKERLSKLTPGKWAYHPADPDGTIITANGTRICGACCCGGFDNEADGEFTAHAKDDMEQLIAAVEKMGTDYPSALEELRAVEARNEALKFKVDWLLNRNESLAAELTALTRAKLEALV